MDYRQLKSKHADELNAFEGIFFAFSNRQFTKGMEQIGLKPNQTSEIYKLPGGGFILRSRSKAFGDLFDRHQREMDDCLKSPDNLLDALTYELTNHEYVISRDTGPALSSLGLDKGSVPPDILDSACLAALNATT